MAIRSKALIRTGCVACGSCLKSCPRGALSIRKGLYAAVDETKCVGCGKCVAACPAGVIELKEREAAV